MDLEPNRPSLIWTAAVGTVAVGLIVAGVNGREARSQAKSPEERSTPVMAVSQPAVERSTAVELDPSFERYRGLIRRNPFAPKLPPPVSIAPVATAPPLLPPVNGSGAPTDEKPGEGGKGSPPAAAPAEPPDPFRDWTYTGTVVIGDQVYAVVENKTSKRGEYVKPGDSFQGAQVEVVAQNELRLSFNGSPKALPKSSAFNATPLNAPPSAAPAGAPGQPGRPGAPGAKPGGPTPPGTKPGAPTAPGAIPAGPAPAAAPGAAGPAVLTAPTAIRILK